jgi:hypothetical protein
VGAIWRDLDQRVNHVGMRMPQQQRGRP